MAKKFGTKIIQSEDPFAICIVAVASLRARPNHSEEQVSQLLWGEQVHIIDRKGKHWYKVRCAWDDYFGWIDARQIFRISEEDFNENRSNQAYALELVQGAMGPTFGLPLCIGSTLTRFDGMSFRSPYGKMTYSGQAIFADSNEIDGNRLVKLGMKYIHAPYQWGGRSPFGIDGSGLIQMIFKLAGISIPRDAKRQISLGEIVDFPTDARPADLAFFEDTKGNITHVGMITEESKILHAYGKVRIDYFDHHGIHNGDLGKYTHKLRLIKRVQVRETAQEGQEEISETSPS